MIKPSKNHEVGKEIKRISKRDLKAILVDISSLSEKEQLSLLSTIRKFAAKDLPDDRTLYMLCIPFETGEKKRSKDG